MAKIYDEPTVATSEGTIVTLDGPDGVAVSLTPEAALKTASRIDEAAVEALLAKHDVGATANHGGRDPSAPAPRDIPPENGQRASIDPVTGEIHGSGVGAGGASAGEDFDSDEASGDGMPLRDRVTPRGQ